MNLGFTKIFPKTKGNLAGKPTLFVERVWAGFSEKELDFYFKNRFTISFHDRELMSLLFANHDYKLDWDRYDQLKASDTRKKHTVRIDHTKRWKAGNKIHFVINSRSSKHLQFAPIIEVISVQRIFMTYAYNKLIEISVGGTELFEHHSRIEFAINDGFDSWDDFFEYFYPDIMNNSTKQFSGVVIHWTNLKY